MERDDKGGRTMNVNDVMNFNGWTNYSTWRINLEFFDGAEYEQEVTHEQLKEEVLEFIDLSIPENNLCKGWVYGFIHDVNWYEIAKHINDNLNERDD